ncbi:hypothetical protein RHGRI_012388 [Rhododendron griersonianum]|uniref:VTT domain-containing protein n=1 Tax=Rhododendron griersonianum TaxID=479676 RepID=A0AAV6KQS2_9ERIC|nr:hypothetical protein RHGRI_012388 [Rhododendron griersonianum]
MAFNWTSFFKITLLILLVAAITTAFLTLPVDKILKDFLLWVKQDLGPWGPFMLAVAYIPLTILAVPASILTMSCGMLVRLGLKHILSRFRPPVVEGVVTKPAGVFTVQNDQLGGGYLFGLPVGFVADSIGATLGAVAAFLIGKTIGRSFVTSKLKDYPQFRAVEIAIQRSGFKIVVLLRLVPLLPFNMLNYLLSVTPVPLGQYMLASWLGMMPITLALVYAGTTLKDLSDVTHEWHEFSKSRWALIITGLLMSVVLLVCVTKVAKAALDKALAENEDIDIIAASPELPILADPPTELRQPLVIKIDSSQENHET